MVAGTVWVLLTIVKSSIFVNAAFAWECRPYQRNTSVADGGELLPSPLLFALQWHRPDKFS